MTRRTRRRQDGRMTLVEAATIPVMGRPTPWMGAWMRKGGQASHTRPMSG